MSVLINPSDRLEFRRPLTKTVHCAMTITNNQYPGPVLYKVKVTNLKGYIVIPNQGRIQPGETMKVLVQHQALESDPAPDAKCKDKVLIETIAIPPMMGKATIQEMWARVKDDSWDGELHRRKLRVAYLPAEEKAPSAVLSTLEAPQLTIPTLTSEPVVVNPAGNLDFNGPAKQEETRQLTLTNNDWRPITFKFKTTKPRLYCVRPNHGRIDPGESADVTIVRQPEQSPDEDYNGKFLVRSMAVTPDMSSMLPEEMWRRINESDENINQQKIKTTYMPPPETIKKASFSAKDGSSVTKVGNAKTPVKERKSFFAQLFSRFRRSSKAL